MRCWTARLQNTGQDPDITVMDEFDIIRRYFERSHNHSSVIVGIGDDGAEIRPDPVRNLVTVIDTLVENVHFPADLSAEDVGFRAVAVNLSDIAAMGARPRWMTLALTLGAVDTAWLEAFAEGLFEAADEFDVALVGGDTTSGSETVVTVQLTGDVGAGQAITRAGAKAGDGIYVTGTLGDAAAGLLSLRNKSTGDSNVNFLRHRFSRPNARVKFGQHLSKIASSAIDVSDGLYADLHKLLSASDLGGSIDIGNVPLSDAMRATMEPDKQSELALAGGDDYELCFTSAAAPSEIEKMGENNDVPVTRIGTVRPGAGLDCSRDGLPVEFMDKGYRHFA